MFLKFFGGNKIVHWFKMGNEVLNKFYIGMFEKLVHLLAHWYAKLKNWQAVWQVGTAS